VDIAGKTGLQVKATSRTGAEADRSDYRVHGYRGGDAVVEPQFTWSPVDGRGRATGALCWGV